MQVMFIEPSGQIDVRHVSDDPNWQRAELQAVVGGTLVHHPIALEGCTMVLGDSSVKNQSLCQAWEINRIAAGLAEGLPPKQQVIGAVVICGVQDSRLGDIADEGIVAVKDMIRQLARH